MYCITLIQYDYNSRDNYSVLIVIFTKEKLLWKLAGKTHGNANPDARLSVAFNMKNF